MAKPAKKDLEKRRKERDRKRRVISERAQAAGIAPWVEPVRPVPPPHVEFPTRPEPLLTADSPTERDAVAEHWLCTARHVPAIVADEFRVILAEILYRMNEDVTEFLRGLKRTAFEPRLARKLDFMSLDRFHVPAAILATYHFYDFLAETQLVDETIRRPSQLVCRDLWKEIKSLFQEKLDEWQPCQFLEQYATWDVSVT